MKAGTPEYDSEVPATSRLRKGDFLFYVWRRPLTAAPVASFDFIAQISYKSSGNCGGIFSTPYYRLSSRSSSIRFVSITFQGVTRFISFPFLTFGYNTDGAPIIVIGAPSVSSNMPEACPYAKFKSGFFLSLLPVG